MKNQQTIIERITKLSNFQLPLYKIEEYETVEEKKKELYEQMIVHFMLRYVLDTNDEIESLKKFFDEFAINNAKDTKLKLLPYMELIKSLNWNTVKDFNFKRPIFKLDEVIDATNEAIEFYYMIKDDLYSHISNLADQNT